MKKNIVAIVFFLISSAAAMDEYPVPNEYWQYNKNECDMPIQEGMHTLVSCFGCVTGQHPTQCDPKECLYCLALTTLCIYFG